MRRRELLTGSAALASYAALQRSAAAFGVGELGANFGRLGAPLGGAGTAPVIKYPPFDFIANNGAQNAISGIIGSKDNCEYNGKIYTVYQGAQYDLYIVRVDKATAQIDQGPLWLAKANLVGDAHGTPRILIESNGTIHVAGGSHVTALIYLRSTASGDITTLAPQTSPLSSCSYPSLHQTSDGKIWLFYRTADHLSTWAYITTSASASYAWSAATTFLQWGQLAYDAAYAYIVKDSADNFHVSWLWEDENNSLGNPNATTIVARYNIYYMKLSSGATVKTNMAGTALATYPPTFASANSECILVSTTPALQFVDVPIPVLDSSNNPYILWVQLTNATTGIPHNYQVAWWNGSSLSQSTITTTDQIFDEYNIECVSGSSPANVVLRAYLTSGGSSGLHGDYDTSQLDRGGSIGEWTSAAGLGSWSQTNSIAVAPSVSALYNTPVLIDGYTSEPKLAYETWQESLTGPYNAQIRLWGPTQGLVRTPFQAETKTLLNSVVASFTIDQQFEIDGMIRLMKGTGLWTKLDSFWLMGGFDAQSSRLDWKRLNDLTLHGASGAGPAFVAGQGFAGNGTDSYHDTGILAAGLTNFTQNDGEFGLWTTNNAQAAAADFGQAFGTSNTYLRVRDTSNITGGQINQTSTFNTTTTDNTLLTCLKRTGASAEAYFRNANSIATATTASVARDGTAGHTIWIGGANLGTPQFSARQIGACFIGGSLTAAQETFLYHMLYSWFRRRGTI